MSHGLDSQQQQQQQQQQQGSERQRHQSTRHSSLSGWIGSLSRRLSLPPSRRSGAPRRQRSSRAQSVSVSSSDEAEPRASPAIVISECEDVQRLRQLSHRERHEINLMYHLMRDHRDALQLCGACLMEGKLLGDGDEEEGDGSCLWWCWGCSEDGSDCEASDRGSDCSRGVPQCRLTKCDSDSCLSTCSDCSKRFKHQRRTDRWNQEFDHEFREKHGFIDRNYSRVHQIK